MIGAIVMEVETIIKECLQYIDRNLEKSMSVSDISSAAGYSEFYFSRIFKEKMHMSVMEYVKKRRLIKASEEILHGSRIIDAAFKYGWQSHGGFTKAFKNEFGFCPEFLKAIAMGMECLRGDGMSHVFLMSTDVHAAKEELVSTLVEEMKKAGICVREKEFSEIYACACEAYDGRKRHSGDEYITHPLNTAIILTKMTTDINVIYAGMFCDVLKETGMTVEQLRVKLPEAVVDIIEKADRFDPKETKVCEDEAVMLVKLAERLHNMRTIEFMEPERRKEKAEETMKLLLRMAGQVKNPEVFEELNDLALKNMDLQAADR